MDPVVLDIEKSNVLDMIISLDHYADHLREIIRTQSAHIEDTPERNELVTATWLSEKLTNLYSTGTDNTYEIRPDEWECLLQSLDIHISALNYVLHTHVEDDMHPYETLMVEKNVHNAWELREKIQNR